MLRQVVTVLAPALPAIILLYAGSAVTTAEAQEFNYKITTSQAWTDTGLDLHPGDLLLVDCHGAVSIPFEVAPDLPSIAAGIQAQERRIIDLCQSPEFSARRLLEVIHTP